MYSHAALPDDTPLNSRTFFAEVGTTAVLDCAITPGALAERYFVTWLNDTSGIFYNLIPPTLGSTPMPFDPRYSIESTNFSLLISDVQLSDSDSTYVCEVGVEDPQFDNRISYYTTTENTNLRLVVYREFTILLRGIDTLQWRGLITCSICKKYFPTCMFFCLGTKVPRLSAGSSDGGTYIRARKRADHLNSAHHKRPNKPGCSGMAQVKLTDN